MAKILDFLEDLRVHRPSDLYVVTSFRGLGAFHSCDRHQYRWLRRFFPLIEQNLPRASRGYIS